MCCIRKEGLEDNSYAGEEKQEKKMNAENAQHLPNDAETIIFSSKSPKKEN